MTAATTRGLTEAGPDGGEVRVNGSGRSCLSREAK